MASEWTRNSPKEPGWYVFWRDCDPFCYAPEIVEIKYNALNMIVEKFGREEYALSPYPAYWLLLPEPPMPPQEHEA